MNIVHKLYGSFALRVLKKSFVRDLHKDCKRKIGHALIFFKTDVFFFPHLAKEYCHSNNWEVLEKVRVLNKLGYWVDVIDRRADVEKLPIEDKYDIFIGLTGGGSGKNVPIIARKLNKAKKVYYATTAESETEAINGNKRYDYFYERHPNTKVKLRRVTDEETRESYEELMKLSDVIFSIGNKYAIDSYRKKFNKPIYRIYPSCSPKITTDLKQLTDRSQKKFLYFGSNGNIFKGLDLIIEAFSTMPDLELHICAPEKEDDFNRVYGEIIKRSSNIHFHGFVEVGGKIFNDVTSQCGYLIFPSCSEGTPVAIASCMRRGLVPFITFESGVDLEDFGHLIEDIHLDALKSQIRLVSQEPKNDFIKRSIKSYLNSFNYTQASFSESFEKAVIKTLKEDVS